MNYHLLALVGLFVLDKQVVHIAWPGTHYFKESGLELVPIFPCQCWDDKVSNLACLFSFQAGFSLCVEGQLCAAQATLCQAHRVSFNLYRKLCGLRVMLTDKTLKV